MLEGSLYVSVETHNSNHWPPPQEIPFLDTHWCLGATHQEITDTPQSEKRGEPTLQVQKGKRVTGIVQAAALGDNRRRSTWEEWNKKKKKKRVQLHRSLDHSPIFGQCFVTAKKNHSPNARAFSMLIFFFFFLLFTTIVQSLNLTDAQSRIHNGSEPKGTEPALTFAIWRLVGYNGQRIFDPRQKTHRTKLHDERRLDDSICQKMWI